MVVQTEAVMVKVAVSTAVMVKVAALVKVAEVMVAAAVVAVQLAAWKGLVEAVEGRLDGVERCHRVHRQVCRRSREMRRNWVPSPPHPH